MMAKIEYIERRFKKQSVAIIDAANKYLDEYARKGFDMTSRQIFYKFASMDLIPNTDVWYRKIKETISNARLAGLIDWSSVVDRTRFLRINGHWNTPKEMLESAAEQYQINMWDRQSFYVEVWIEKDALVGMIESVCREYDVPYFSCRGYSSQSAMWRAGLRMIEATEAGKKAMVLYLGDHDPSGIDMTRDIFDRLKIFVSHHSNEIPKIKRIALTKKQIDEYSLTSNPTKFKDSRAGSYISEFGRKSWELDALDPEVMSDLIRSNLDKLINKNIWKSDAAKIKRDKKILSEIAKGI